MKAGLILGVLCVALFFGDTLSVLLSDSYKEFSAEVTEVSLYEDLAYCYDDEGNLYRVVLSSLGDIEKGDLVTLYKMCPNIIPTITGFRSYESARASTVVMLIGEGIGLVVYVIAWFLIYKYKEEI